MKKQTTSRRRIPARNGFSLIEVSVSLGLVGFCFVSLLGLLELGLRQQRDALAETEAAHILSAVVDGFQGRTRVPAGITEVPGSEPLSLEFPDAGGDAAETSFVVDESGAPQSSPVGSNLYVVHYRVEPPAANSAGAAPYKIHLVVAWPGGAKFNGSGTQLALAGAQGSVEATLELNHD
jgi:uncharacterized protein (TIGR02598 family)